MDDRAFTAIRDLARSEAVSVRVRGTCMAPHLEGEAVTQVRARKVYLPGDVIVFRRRSGELAAHRVIGFRPLSGRLAIVAKGDACEVHDAPVFAEDVIGVVDGAKVGAARRVAAVAEFARIAIRRAFR